MGKMVERKLNRCRSFGRGSWGRFRCDPHFATNHPTSARQGTRSAMSGSPRQKPAIYRARFAAGTLILANHVSSIQLRTARIPLPIHCLVNNESIQ